MWFVFFKIVFVGIGATLVMDLWSWIQTRFLKIPSLNYALVARWVLYIPKGKLFHAPIMASESMRGEMALGWFLHYSIGVVFAMAHILTFGRYWLVEPSLSLGLLTGIVTLVFPLFIIQPCLGFGIAANKTPRPWKARLLSLLAHSSYGFGLYVTAYAIEKLV